MTFHPVVDVFPIVPPLDPIWLVLFTGAFVACALATQRRTGYGAAILALAAPFTFAHAALGTTVTLEKVAVVGVLAGLLGAPGAREVLRRREMLVALAAFAALIGADALTLLVARYRVDTLRETLKWCEYLAFFAAAAIAYASDPRPKLVRAAVAVSAAIVAVSAIAEIFTGAHSGIWIAGKAYPRIAGLLDGPNQLGGYLEAAVAAIAAWQVRDPRRWQAALLAILGYTLLLTFSRGALVGVLAITASIAFFERGRVLRLWPLYAGVGAGFAQTLLWGEQSAVTRLGGGNAAVAGGVGSRSELWRAAWFFFRHHPILGIGAGNYQYELAQAGVNGVRTQANSWYLGALAEGGVVLFGATVFWLAVMLRATRRGIARSPWALGAFAATVALAMHGVVDDLIFYPKVAEPWIVLIALGIASSHGDRDP